MRTREPSHHSLGAAILAVVAVAACREQVLQPTALPQDAVMSKADSVEMLARGRRSLPPGIFLVPVASDSMVLAMTTDSFTIQLTERECAAPNNWIVLTSPTLDTLSATMCQEPIETIWSFADGPYSVGTAIVLDFESGVSGYDGQVQFSDTLPVAFPQWNLEFEDAGDNDFNDFLLRVQAYTDSLPELETSVDTTFLHPWIDSTTFDTPDTLFVQDDRVGDSTLVVITTSLGGAPSPGADLVVTAELVPGAGGHSHQADRITFADLPTFSYAAGGPRPVAGYFKQGSTRSDSIVATTDSLGQVSFRFVAGFVGGRVDLVVNASLAGAQIADTVKLTVQVPGLSDLVTQGSLADSVYFIGPKQPHQSDSTWYAQSAFAGALRSLVRQISRPDSSEFLRLNDTSLPMGGSFTLEGQLFEVSTGNKVDRPGTSHYSHAYGVDIDMSTCFSSTKGKQEGFTNPSCGPDSVSVDRLWEVALGAGLIVILEGSPRHFHLRLGSETLRVPK